MLPDIKNLSSAFYPHHPRPLQPLPANAAVAAVIDIAVTARLSQQMLLTDTTATTVTNIWVNTTTITVAPTGPTSNLATAVFTTCEKNQKSSPAVL
jgi:hypothetical protein